MSPPATIPPATADASGGGAPRGERRVQGLGVAPGVAIGPAYLYAGGAWQAQRDALAPGDVAAELARFEAAVARSERELARVATVAREKVGDGSAAIFEAQAMMLRDSSFYDAVTALVEREHLAAGWAVQSVFGDVRARLEGSGSAAMRERSADVTDVQDRVLRNLQKGRATSRIARDHVVVAETLSAADVLLFSRRGILGCVLDAGGPTSHVAIMARALGVPAVVSLSGLAGHVEPGATVVLDGFAGTIVVDPTPETVAAYRARAERFARLTATAGDLDDEPDATADGHPVVLQANVEFREEFALLDAYRARGVGLFRTEMLFLAHGQALDEDQQAEVYADAFRATAPHPVTVRLLDLGGDKVLPFAHREANPFLGWRGVRILLDRPDLLRAQLRAVLRAAVDAPADAPPRLLLPMVSSLGEVDAMRRALTEAAAALTAEGVAHRADLPLGIMVEVPAVALMADRFAEAVDFFSIGTNDLTQFTLAVDRGNDRVAGRFRELHPAVLALVARTVAAGRAAGLPVSVCGEIAADPRVTPLLVGLGVDTLSAAPAYLSLVKRVLRAFTMAEARALAVNALAQRDAGAVESLLQAFLASHNDDLAALFAS